MLLPEFLALIRLSHMWNVTNFSAACDNTHSEPDPLQHLESSTLWADIVFPVVLSLCPSPSAVVTFCLVQ